MDITNAAMIALYPDAATKNRIAGLTRDFPDAVPAEDLHLTLSFLGTFEENPIGIAEKLSGRWAGIPLTGTSTATTLFGDGEDKASVLLIDSLQLVDLYVAVREVLWNDCGLVSPSEHGFMPHITYAYSEVGPIETHFPVTFDRIAFAYQNEQYDLWTSFQESVYQINQVMDGVRQQIVSAMSAFKV